MLRRFMENRIHKFSVNDKNIVLDVNSTSIFVLDDLAYEMVDYVLQGKNRVMEVFKEENQKEVEEIYDELSSLVESGYLYSEDIAQEASEYNQDNIIKALCLNVTHDCDLRCRYCFASQGDYSGQREMMSFETGKRALDFLVENSGNRRNLEVDFFGGEPLMNFDVVKDLTLYGQSLLESKGKNIRFTMTTNGLGLTDKIMEFLNQHMSNIVLSLDGRKTVNDNMRPTVNGKSSYDVIVPKLQKMVKLRGDKDYYIRGTFTNENLDFSEDAVHFFNLGFDKISLEPAVTDPKEPYAIREEHLEKILEEYEKFSKIYMDINSEEDRLLFFHFMIDLSDGPCIAKRSVGCGAGSEYISITPNGDIYPCHQFVGEEEFILGNLDEGIVNTGLRDMFKRCSVFEKEACQDCWAKLFCSGGCHANAYFNNDSLQEPFELACQMQKKRTELALSIAANKSG